MSKNDCCGYYYRGFCTFHDIDCIEVPLEKCVSIKELEELVK